MSKYAADSRIRWMCRSRRTITPSSSFIVSSRSNAGSGDRHAALLNASAYSASVVESQVTPPPTPNSVRPVWVSIAAVRIATLKIASPPGATNPIAPQYTPRGACSIDAISRMLLLFGAPVIDPAGKQRAEHVRQRRALAQRAFDGRDQLKHRRIALDLEQRHRPHRPDLRDAPDVVAREIDDHHVLGAVLLRRRQPRRPLLVLFAPSPARRRALHRLRRDPPAANLEEQLRRQRQHAPAAEIQIRGIRRALRLASWRYARPDRARCCAVVDRALSLPRCRHRRRSSIRLAGGTCSSPDTCRRARSPPSRRRCPRDSPPA